MATWEFIVLPQAQMTGPMASAYAAAFGGNAYDARMRLSSPLPRAVYRAADEFDRDSRIPALDAAGIDFVVIPTEQLLEDLPGFRAVEAEWRGETVAFTDKAGATWEIPTASELFLVRGRRIEKMESQSKEVKTVGGGGMKVTVEVSSSSRKEAMRAQEHLWVGEHAIPAIVDEDRFLLRDAGAPKGVSGLPAMGQLFQRLRTAPRLGFDDTVVRFAQAIESVMESARSIVSASQRSAGVEKQRAYSNETALHAVSRALFLRHRHKPAPGRRVFSIPEWHGRRAGAVALHDANVEMEVTGLPFGEKRVQTVIEQELIVAEGKPSEGPAPAQIPPSAGGAAPPVPLPVPPAAASAPPVPPPAAPEEPAVAAVASVDDVRAALQADPRNVDLRFQLLAWLREDGKIDEAAVEAESIVKDKGYPRDVRVRAALWIVEVRREKGDLKAALRAAHRAEMDDPANVDVKLLLAHLYAEQGNPAPAREILDGLKGLKTLTPAQRAEVEERLKRLESA